MSQETERLRKALGRIANIAGPAKKEAWRRKEVANVPLSDIHEIAEKALRRGQQ